jgi:hypothetical protein
MTITEKIVSAFYRKTLVNPREFKGRDHGVIICDKTASRVQDLYAETLNLQLDDQKEQYEYYLSYWRENDYIEGFIKAIEVLSAI